MFDFTEALGLNRHKDMPPPPPEAQLAALFMKRLKGDFPAAGEPATLEQALDRVAQSADIKSATLDKNALEKIADKLIDSLDALVRDEYVKNPDGSFVTDAEGKRQIEKVGLDPGVKNSLRELIVESGAKNTAELANVLKNFDNNPDPEKKEDLFFFLHRGGKDFAVTYAEDEIAMVRDFLNMLSPGLGDTITGFLGFKSGNGANADGRETTARLEQGFKAMMGGNASLERFWNPPQKNGWDGKSLPLNSRHSVQPSEWENYFSDSPGGNLKYAYHFYGEPGEGERPDLANRGFRETVLKRWEAEGTVSFSNDAARDDFIRYVKQTVQGGALDRGFLDTLQGKGTEGLIKFDTPEAEARFGELTASLSVLRLNPEEMAKEIMKIVEREPGMSFKPLDPAFDPKVYEPSTKKAIMDALVHYYPAQSSKEFAERIQKLAQDHPGIALGKPDDPKSRQTFEKAAAYSVPPSQSSSSPPSSPPALAPAQSPQDGDGDNGGRSSRMMRRGEPVTVRSPSQSGVAAAGTQTMRFDKEKDRLVIEDADGITPPDRFESAANGMTSELRAPQNAPLPVVPGLGR